MRVTSETLPWASDEQHQFYVVNLEGASPGFDVMMLDCIWVPEFARAGWLLDLTPLVPADALAPHFPAAADAAVWDGRTWALPWNMNALEAMWASGATIVGADGTVFPDPARAAEGLALLRRLIETGVSPAWVTAADEELSRRAFGEGRAIFLRNWPYVLTLVEAPGSPVRGRVGLAPLPGHATGARGAGSTGGSHLGVWRGTRHPALAAALVRFLTSEEAQRQMLRGAALYPTRTALYHDRALVGEHPWLPAIHALTLAARPRPVTPWYLLLSVNLQPELSAALVGLKSPARAIDDARRRLEHFLGPLR